MLRSEVLTLQQAEQWSEALESMLVSDVYFTPAYHLAYEKNGDGQAHLFIAQQGEHRFCYPFMRRPIIKVGSTPIEVGWYDIESVYGYTGALANTHNADFLVAAWREFGAWCQQQNVIAEFVRFHPLLQTHQWASHHISLERQTVVVPLVTEKPLLDSYPSGFRTPLRQAYKYGLRCEISKTALPNFLALYTLTMQHLNAHEYYAFSEIYFETLLRETNSTIFVVYHADQPIAAAIFMYGGDYLHYHLAGSHRETLKMRPNHLMLHTAAEWGSQQGAKILHLGGGTSPEPDDSLFKFKASMSHTRAEFYIGRRVHHETVYRELCDLWLHEFQPAERPPYFLLYRR